MTLHEKGALAIDEYLKEYPTEKGEFKTRKEVYEIMHTYQPEISIDKNNVPPTDLCWNSVNNKPGSKIYDDFEHWPHALENVGGMFKLLGTDIAYTGNVMHAGLKILFARWKDGVYERINEEENRAVDIPEHLRNRLLNLYEGVKEELKTIPVNVRINKSAVEVNFQELLVCGVNVEEEVYKLYNVTSDWADVTTYHCEESVEGTWFYYIDTIDECIGETKRLVMFEAQKGSKKPTSVVSFSTQIEKEELNIPKNWKGDPRAKFINVFNPLVADSEFSFKLNTTDSSSKILELYRKGETKRIMGMAGKQDMSLNVFFNPDFYKSIKAYVDLPENEKGYRSQPHMNLTFAQVWNVICVATGKKQYMEMVK